MKDVLMDGELHILGQRGISILLSLFLHMDFEQYGHFTFLFEDSFLPFSLMMIDLWQ
jgi:hypothetical protein